MSHTSFQRSQTTRPAVDQAEAGLLLSALADGELSAAECERLMQHLATAPECDALLQAWESYHIAGECLRTGRAGASSSGAFLQGLRARMAQEAAMNSVVHNGADTAQPEPAPVLTNVAVASGYDAANAAVFRWKMVAGVASLAAVAAIGWNSVARFSPVGQGMQLAEGSSAAQKAAAAQQQALAAFSGDATERSPQRTVVGMPYPASPAGQGQVLLRDPQLDELLARQYAHTLALQPPAPFLRNASAQQPGQ
ncbi:anti-anti-sigma factor [Allofranklinella schreckenbergeri]|uniref:Anti-anti-sigma factor n=1 Tax=Allofranklinella schreckenbergeri TaxID=1076744 RepID=A0A3M6R1Q9_9BURK|nr:sigma-E factor negative regulatory protein [Allofranklinella schreckenbergeri]RMX09155.1 anti-anti-sigma factor [Allofranklinella schreckenbergeri]